VRVRPRAAPPPPPPKMPPKMSPRSVTLPKSKLPKSTVGPPGAPTRPFSDPKRSYCLRL
jgi:hypothetical protein